MHVSVEHLTWLMRKISQYSTNISNYFFTHWHNNLTLYVHRKLPADICGKIFEMSKKFTSFCQLIRMPANVYKLLKGTYQCGWVEYECLRMILNWLLIRKISVCKVLQNKIFPITFIDHRNLCKEIKRQWQLH